MGKWEYLFAISAGGGDVARVGQMKLPSGSRFEWVVRILGEDGWELVGFNQVIGGMIVFKRTWTDNSYDGQSLLDKLDAMHG